MTVQRIVRTTLDPQFADLIPSTLSVAAMPFGWDIAGGDTAGWGRGLFGPVWLSNEGGLLFSDAGHRRRLLWVPGQDPVFAGVSPGTMMGQLLDGRGRLVSADWEGQRIIAEDSDGALQVLADRCDGKSFNRPVDLCAGPAGSLLFLDQKQPFPPSAGDSHETSGIYRIDTDGSVHRLPIDLALPGGLAYDAEHSRLLVSDPEAGSIMAFPMTADGNVDAGGKSILATLRGDGKGAPHGLVLDEAGRIYTGGPGGLWVIDAEGKALGILHLTTSRINALAIGGGKLFVATLTGIGAIDLPGTTTERTRVPNAPAVLRQPIDFNQFVERHDPALDRILAQDVTIANHGSAGFFEDLGGGENGWFGRSLEGLFWDSREDCLKFSDISNNRRLRLTPSTNHVSLSNQPTGNTNGATLDRDGSVLSCEQSGRRISRLLPNGDCVTVVDRTADGRRLNRPNDITVRSDGNIYFTDPWWDFGSGGTRDADDGIVGSFMPGMAKTRRLRPDGVLETFADGWLACNGLALSVDEKVLFVNDTIKMHIRAFDLREDGSVDESSDRVHCELPGAEDGKPDGMKLDLAGNIYCGGPGGLWVMNPEGKHLGTIRHGACQTNNLCFGEADWQTLFFCSWTALFSIRTLIPGVKTLDVRNECRSAKL